MIENMHDIPYLKGTVGPEIVAAMTAIGTAVKSACSLPCGIQILAGANVEALAVAHACDLSFVRVEAFSYAHIADEGILEASAGELLRYRRLIGAAGIKILADAQKKHSSHAVTSDIPLRDWVRTTEFCGADGVIITGCHTGESANLRDLEEATGATEKLAILIGSGLCADTIRHYSSAQGFIVGSSIKKEGNWKNSVCPKRSKRIVAAFEEMS